MKIVLLFAVLLAPPVLGQDTVTTDYRSVIQLLDLPYKTEGDAYELDRCQLDLYLPTNTTAFPILVWLHGGGLTVNSKDSLEASEVGVRMAVEGVGTAVINYRLSPRATFPAYLDDVAAAIRWVFDHVRHYNGVPEQVFVGGHSAGAYLAAMVALDPAYLQQYGLTPDSLAGAICISGQMDSHQTIKRERKLPADEKIIDSTAPLYFVNDSVSPPPFLVLYADRDLPQRDSINIEFADSLRQHQQAVVLQQVKNRDHLSIIRNILREKDETAQLMKEFIHRRPTEEFRK